MKPPRSSIGLSQAEIEAGTVAHERLFLGRFDEGALRAELDRGGVLEGMRARGYDDVVLSTSFVAGEHQLRIRPRERRVRLVDLRLSESSLVVEDAVARSEGIDILSVLTVRWLSCQDPRRSFTAERPRLPGQRYPGLGVGRGLYALLRSWAAQWGKDGLLNLPEYFHNAVFYSETFRFISSQRQGQFESLARDLGALQVARASAAVDEGRVVVEPGGRTFEWTAAEMIAPLSDRVSRYLGSAAYAAAVERSAAETKYRLR